LFVDVIDYQSQRFTTESECGFGGNSADEEGERLQGEE
jgi:hypothetical protein